MANLTIITPRGTVYQKTLKNGKIKAVLEWNPGFGKKMTGNFTRGQMFIDSECLRHCDPLLPLDTGLLKLSGTLHTVIGSGVVQYKTPYARRWYYEAANFHSAPQRGRFWFERMKLANKQSILRGAQRIVRGGM